MDTVGAVAVTQEGGTRIREMRRKVQRRRAICANRAPAGAAAERRDGRRPAYLRNLQRSHVHAVHFKLKQAELPFEFG